MQADRQRSPDAPKTPDQATFNLDLLRDEKHKWEIWHGGRRILYIAFLDRQLIIRRDDECFSFPSGHRNIPGVPGLTFEIKEKHLKVSGMRKGGYKLELSEFTDGQKILYKNFIDQSGLQIAPSQARTKALVSLALAGIIGTAILLSRGCPSQASENVQAVQEK